MAQISKFDEDQRLIFGWAYVVSEDGGQSQVIDKSGDFVDIEDIEELEKAAYKFVLTSRVGGDFHQRPGEGEFPLHVSDMVESVIITPEKVEKMGLPAHTPLGWWVGFKVNDETTWQRIKSGGYTQFSVHGKGVRTPV